MGQQKISNPPQRHIISLGAGVQSSTMALMAAHGELTPMPECAVFADTGAEPQYVYEWLDWLETKLPFPVYRVMHKDGLLQSLIENIPNQRFAAPPFFTQTDKVRGRGRLRRQCTKEFKIQPIEEFIRRKMLNLAYHKHGPKYKAIACWVGISMDEIQRMKEARPKFIENLFPLIDQKPMTRQQCLDWMAEKGYPLPKKSSCTFCPYHDDNHWKDMKANDPKSWEQAVNIDKLIRDGVRGTNQKLFLHESLKPLEEVEFKGSSQKDMFEEECDGMCGV